MIDRRLLLRLFRIGGAADFRRAVQQELLRYNIKFQVDENENIFSLVHPNLPILCAHMDTVQNNWDRANASLISISEKAVEGPCMIGADDKCGVYIILHLLQQGVLFNFILVAIEENPFNSSILPFLKKNDISIFPFAIVLDSPGGYEIQCSSNGSSKFKQNIFKIGFEFGFRLVPCNGKVGVGSNLDDIKVYINCINISVGYYYLHSKYDYALLENMNLAEEFVLRILTQMTSKVRLLKKINLFQGNVSVFSL